MAYVQRYCVRQKLLTILQSAGATESQFTTKQILTYLGKYIEQRKLNDNKNIRIVRCKGDALEDIFGVQEFLIDSFQELWNFIFPYIVPATDKEIAQLENKQSASDNSEHEDANIVTRLEHCWMSQLPWWYFVQKHDNANNNDEVKTVSGSIMNDSTAYVQDTEYSSDSSDSVRILSHGERFSVEYEPDSDSDCGSGSTEPVIESDDDETEYSTPSIPLTDSSDNTIGEDYWQCTECPNMNPPIVGYCQRCWKLRKGWLKASVPDSSITTSQSLPSNHEFNDVRPLPHCSSEPLGVDVIDGKGSKRPRSPELSQESSTLRKKLNLEVDDSKTVSSASKSNPSSSKHSESVDSVSPNSDPPGKIDLTEKPPNKEQTQGTNGFSTLPFNKPNLPEMPGICNICRSKPNDSSFIHGKVGHQYCCYKCALKVERSQKRCPVCREPIDLVIKNFIYQM